MITLHNYQEKKLDTDKIAGLFKSSFNMEFDENYWNWRFLNNPNSKDVFIVYAMDEGRLAAYYAVSPMSFEVGNGKKVKIALSNLTMTHPDYQGRGLFSQLATLLFNTLNDKGFVGVYGFANINSHYGFRKNLGWKDISALNIFQLQKERFKGFLLKEGGTESNFLEKEIGKVKRETITEFVRTNNLIRLAVDYENFLWRFCDIPNQHYKAIERYVNDKLTGLLVFKEFGDEIDIMEFWSVYDDQKERALELVKSISFVIRKYQKNINIWSNIHSEEHIVLEKFGFREMCFNSYFGFIPFVDAPEYLDVRNWHYRFTDSDIF